MHNLKINLEMSSGEKIVPCTIEYCLDASVKMIFSCALFQSVSVEADNLFDAFSLIRTEVERYGYLILCNGSRKDAYPSRMSKQMGRGSKIYLLNRNVPARSEDLVDLFGIAKFEQIGTVVEQYEAYKTWLQTLGAPLPRPVSK